MEGARGSGGKAARRLAPTGPYGEEGAGGAETARGGPPPAPGGHEPYRYEPPRLGQEDMSQLVVSHLWSNRLWYPTCGQIGRAQPSWCQQEFCFVMGYLAHKKQRPPRPLQ